MTCGAPTLDAGGQTNKLTWGKLSHSRTSRDPAKQKSKYKSISLGYRWIALN